METMKRGNFVRKPGENLHICLNRVLKESNDCVLGIKNIMCGSDAQLLRGGNTRFNVLYPPTKTNLN